MLIYTYLYVQIIIYTDIHKQTNKTCALANTHTQKKKKKKKKLHFSSIESYSDFKMLTFVPTLPGAGRCTVNLRAGWPGISIL